MMTKEDVARKCAALAQTAGRTEEEALTAISLMNKILDKYNMSLDDVTVRQEGCEKLTFKTSIKTREKSHLGGVCTAIAALTSTKVWHKSGRSSRDNPLEYVFFGRETDLEFVKFLYNTCSFACQLEAVVFKLERKIAGEKTLARHKQAFLFGMGDRLAKRIRELVDAQKAQGDSCNALVVVKMSFVNEEFAKLGLNLGHARRQQRTHQDANSYNAGNSAAEGVSLGRPLGKPNTSATLRIGKG